MAHHDVEKAEIHLKRTVVITLATLLLLSCAVAAAKPSPEPCPVHAGAWSSAGQLRSLIAAGADVNDVDELGDTMLISALRFGLGQDFVNVLLQAGADVNAKSMVGETVLMLALQFQHGLDVVTALLQAGADVNAKDATGRTPLLYAAMYSPNPRIIQALLNAGADPRAKADDGWTAFDAAGYHDSIRNSDVYWLLKPDGTTARPSLLDLGSWRSADELRSLIEAGADVNEVDEAGNTSLMSAVMRDYGLDVITALLDAGADANAGSTEDSWSAARGQTALMYATISARVDVMNALILAGADVNAADGNGETPLTTAAMYSSVSGYVDAVRALIAAGADVNAKDKLGWTPLIFAVSRVPNPEVIRALLNAGADRRAKTDMGKTAFDLAELNNKIRDTDEYWLLKPDTP